MQTKSLVAYFLILAILCEAVIGGALMLGRQGAYLAQFYMLTPAVAALITRLFFYGPRFQDANLRFGRIKDYLRYWLIALGIVALYFISYTLLGAITWDWSGAAFLQRLAQQFAAAGQDMNASLPPGITPEMMLMIYFIGGLTLFNIPGIVTGFGEEFGHRGFMFPALYRIRPWVGILIGGLIWYLWHMPLILVVPQQAAQVPAWQRILDLLILGIGSVCTFTYLAYVYVKTQSVFVTSIAHIAMNNASMSLSYFAILHNQFLGNLGTTLVMVLVVAVLYWRKEFDVFPRYFETRYPDAAGHT